MKAQSLIIILAFLVVSVLGFSTLAHESHATGHDCIFNSNVNCLQATNPISSVLGHISSLQNSIQANVASSASVLLALSFLLIILGGLVFIEGEIKVSQYLRVIRSQVLESISRFRIEFLAWLAIFNKQDLLVLSMAHK